MKRLLVIAVGIGVVLGTVSFAQDSKDTTDSKKMVSKKKGKKKATTKSTGDTK